MIGSIVGVVVGQKLTDWWATDTESPDPLLAPPFTYGESPVPLPPVTVAPGPVLPAAPAGPPSSPPPAPNGGRSSAVPFVVGAGLLAAGAWWYWSRS